MPNIFSWCYLLETLHFFYLVLVSVPQLIQLLRTSYSVPNKKITTELLLLLVLCAGKQICHISDSKSRPYNNIITWHSASPHTPPCSINTWHCAITSQSRLLACFYCLYQSSRFEHVHIYIYYVLERKSWTKLCSYLFGISNPEGDMVKVNKSSPFRLQEIG